MREESDRERNRLMELRLNLEILSRENDNVNIVEELLDDYELERRMSTCVLKQSMLLIAWLKHRTKFIDQTKRIGASFQVSFQLTQVDKLRNLKFKLLPFFMGL